MQNISCETAKKRKYLNNIFFQGETNGDGITTITAAIITTISVIIIYYYYYYSKQYIRHIFRVFC